MDIATIAKKAEPILEKNHVSHASVFGSFARGEQRLDSDVDILVKFKETPSLFSFIRIENELSDALGKKVDLATEGSLHRFIKKNVLKDAKIFYER